MLIGETLIGGHQLTFFTPWMTRQGDGVSTTLEIIDVSANTKVTAKLFEKNSEDTGDGVANATGSVSRTTNGVSSFRNTAIKELVRYHLTIEQDSGLPLVDAVFWTHYRFLAPAWEMSGAQSI